MDNRKEILYSDLPALVSDPSQLSTIRVLDKWATVTYETPKVSGTMLYAAPKVKPAIFWENRHASTLPMPK